MFQINERSFSKIPRASVAADELAQSDMTERRGFLQNFTSECRGR